MGYLVSFHIFGVWCFVISYFNRNEWTSELVNHIKLTLKETCPLPLYTLKILIYKLIPS